MTEGAEEALAALARDLIEEITVGRAVELANVRGYRRFERGHEELVRPYNTLRPGGWIPQPAWEGGQQDYEQAGEAVWRAHQWQRHLGSDVDEPKTGAAAVHPHLGAHLRRQPGDTISGHAYRHVPKPPPVDRRKVELAQAHEHLAAYRQRETDRADYERASKELADHVADQLAAGRADPTAAYAPLSDDQYAAHLTRANAALADALHAGLSTDRTETSNGQWNAARSELHNRIIEDHLNKAVRVPSERRGLMLGGLGGSGKTTTLKQLPDVDLSRYAVVNPDDIKEEMAALGMIPEVPGLAPMEAAALIHEESSHIANLLAARLLEVGKNLAYDITMSSPEGVIKRLDRYRQHGYRDVKAVFVHIPVEMSVERATARHRRGLEQYRQGHGFGGRLVPADVIRSAALPDGSTTNRQTFENLRPRFDGGWQLWDNSGAQPVKIDALASSLPPSTVMSVEDLQRLQRGINTGSAGIT